MKSFDVSIVGGGLAGLSASIELARKGYKVALFEKKEYPFHKVCGEYISMESWDYIKYLGINLDELNLPIIDELHFSTEKGAELRTKLPLGGFGISRFTLDHLLSKEAELHGVSLFQNTSVEKVHFDNKLHSITTKTGSVFLSRVLIGSFGKKSKLDLNLKRSYLASTKKEVNFVGVKYHIETDLPENEIGLHLFQDGYCGVSKVDGASTYCMCYLTIAENLKKFDSIATMEQELFKNNKHLLKLLSAPRLYDEALTISQISFKKKSQIEDHMLLLGDAAGLITPLSGNGMSMAMNAAHFSVKLIDRFLKNELSRGEMEKTYKRQWGRLFSIRLWVSRKLQTAIYNASIASLLVRILNKNALLRSALISLTHGKPFFMEKESSN